VDTVISLTVGAYVWSLVPAGGAAHGEGIWCGACTGSGEPDIGGVWSLTRRSFRGFVEHRS
jgi:hypothetical protein